MYPQSTSTAQLGYQSTSIPATSQTEEPRLNTAFSPFQAWILCGLFCATFFPYPGLSIGQKSSIPIGILLSPVLALYLPQLMAISSRLFSIFAGVNVAMVLSFLIHSQCADGFEVSFAAKGMVMFNLCFMQLTVGILVARLSLVRLGWCLATVIALNLVATFVMITSENLRFRIIQDIFNHPGFGEQLKMLQAAKHANYRAAGLFPEPSAMAACLGPWAGYLLWMALEDTRKGLRVLAAVSFAGCGLLLLLSVSGFVILFGLACVIFTLWELRHRPKHGLALLGVLGVACAVAFTVGDVNPIERLNERIQRSGQQGMSWGERSDSMVFALEKWFGGDAVTLLLGVGPFQSSSIAQQEQGFDGVWSVTLSLLLENGLVGAVFGAYILFLCLRYTVTSPDRSGRLLMFCLWFVGASITTSYYTLLPLWTALGFLIGDSLPLSPIAKSQAGLERPQKYLQQRQSSRFGLGPT
jgi:hypothetical protein